MTDQITIKKRSRTSIAGYNTLLKSKSFVI